MTFFFRTNILMLNILLFQVMSACTSQSSAAQAPEPPGTTFPRVSMPDTEVRSLNSSVTGRNYDIYIRLPDEGVTAVKRGQLAHL